MPTGLSTIPPAVRAEIHAMKASWYWFLALGAVLTVVGFAAISMAFVASLATVVTIGMLCLIAAGAEIASAVWAGKWEGVFLHLLCGVLYGVFGFLILSKPGAALVTLTMLIAAVFLVSGAFRIAMAGALRFHNWGWALASGVISVALGLMIWQDLPEAAVWVIGTFVGIDLVFTGWTWVMFALGLKALPEPPAA